MEKFFADVFRDAVAISYEVTPLEMSMKLVVFKTEPMIR